MEKGELITLAAAQIAAGMLAAIYGTVEFDGDSYELIVRLAVSMARSIETNVRAKQPTK